jgi:hypothetical protein
MLTHAVNHALQWAHARRLIVQKADAVAGSNILEFGVRLNFSGGISVGLPLLP